MSLPNNTQPVALKEWAMICHALACGKQTILLRKGGIAEEHGEFRPEHDEFWLFPTGFHQSTDQVIESYRPEAKRFLDSLSHDPQQITLQYYARIQNVDKVTDEDDLAKYRTQHVLTDEVVRQRFYYRTPGLFVFSVTVESFTPWTIPNKPEYDGCHSWVDLQID